MNFAMGQMTLLPRVAAAEYFPMTPEAGGRLAALGRRVIWPMAKFISFSSPLALAIF